MWNCFKSTAKFGAKTVLYTSTVTIVGGSIFLHQTKPPNESFNDVFTENRTLDEKIIINATLDYLIKPTFKDWVLFKTATMSYEDKKMVYIGAANNWRHWYDDNKH